MICMYATGGLTSFAPTPLPHPHVILSVASRKMTFHLHVKEVTAHKKTYHLITSENSTHETEHTLKNQKCSSCPQEHTSIHIMTYKILIIIVLPFLLTLFIPSNFRGINLSGPSNFQCWGRKTGAPTK